MSDIYLTAEEEVVEVVEVGQQGLPGPPGPAGEGVALADTDTIEARLAGDAHPLANLRKGDGAALANPFTVAQAGGADSWQVLLPTARPIDAYHVEGAAMLADLSRLHPAPVLHFSAEPADPPEPWFYDVRVFGSITIPATASIQPDGAIDFTFSEAVTGVTCNGDGTGTLEATDGTSYAPSVSTADNITYTLQPPVAGWIETSTITLTGKTTIAAVADATKLYDGLGFHLAVAELAPDVTAPAMTAFTVEATSSDSVINITALSATDDRAVTGYQVNTSAVAPDPAVGTWQSAAAWISGGYETGQAEGTGPTTYNLYTWARDAAGNVSLSSTASCTVTIPANQAPSAPVISLASTGDTTATIQVNTGSTDAEDGAITLYDVFVGGVEHAANVTIAQGGTYQLTGLTNDVQVSITLKAQDSGGLLSAASNAVLATPSIPVVLLPFTDQFNTDDTAMWADVRFRAASATGAFPAGLTSQVTGGEWQSTVVSGESGKNYGNMRFMQVGIDLSEVITSLTIVGNGNVLQNAGGATYNWGMFLAPEAIPAGDINQLPWEQFVHAFGGQSYNLDGTTRKFYAYYQNSGGSGIGNSGVASDVAESATYADATLTFTRNGANWDISMTMDGVTNTLTNIDMSGLNNMAYLFLYTSTTQTTPSYTSKYTSVNISQV